MNRVNWDGEPFDQDFGELPRDLKSTIFDYLPPPIPMTPVINELAEKYLGGQITGQDYLAMQAAAFIRPHSKDQHQSRREKFSLRAKEAEARGFTIPDTFRTLVENDVYVDRLHHNCIWLQMPDEVVPLPSAPSQLVFLAFEEGQGCLYWHLLLASDGSHSMVCCEEAFGVQWEDHYTPDFGALTMEKCADSIEEWLFYFFKESAEHDQRYLEHLKPYHD